MLVGTSSSTFINIPPTVFKQDQKPNRYDSILQWLWTENWLSVSQILSYPNSRDAIASKNNLLLIRMAQLPLKIYERTQSVYTLRVSPGTCHVSNRQSDQVQQSCNEDLRR